VGGLIRSTAWSWATDGDQLGAFGGIQTCDQLPIEVVESLRRVTSLVEPGSVHGFDLPFLHPHRVCVVADGSGEVVVLVDQVGAVGAGGDDDDDALIARSPSRWMPSPKSGGVMAVTATLRRLRS